MGKRGPKSAAEREAACLISEDFRKPPKPPGDLNEGQKSTWKLIVNRLPSDWFAFENYPLLIQYCRHVSRARLVGQMIGEMETGETMDLRVYCCLLRSETEQSRIINSLATKMRLTQQSTYDKSKKKPFEGPKPWEPVGKYKRF